MNKEEALAIVSEKLDQVLHGAGFARAPGTTSFTRTIPRGCQSIGIAVSNFGHGVELTLLVKVRLDDVEDVTHMFDGAPEEFRHLSNTVVTSLDDFSGGSSPIRISSPNELRATLDAWEGVIQSKVLPYLDEATDVVALDRLINQEGAISDTTLPPYCYISQIIIAKLAGNPSFDELAVNHVDRLIRGRYPTDRYEAVLSYLDPD